MSNSVTLDASPPKLSPAKKPQQKISCVLLVCVYDTIVFEITNELICSRFQEFGSIVRVLIFQRKEVTKFFIQFGTNEEASKAKEALDGKKLCNNICKMSIYYSNFDNVDLKHQTSQGVDFINQKIYNQEPSVSSTNKSPTKPFDDFEEFEGFGSYGIPRLSENEFYLPRSKTDANEIQWHLNKLKKQEESNWSGLLYIDQSIKSDIDSILNCEANQCQNWSQTNESPKRSPAPRIKNSELKDDGLTVLGFKIKGQLKHGHLYNLYSNFGNVSMIKITKSEAMIKFRTPEFAAIANNYLNNSWLFGNKMELSCEPGRACLPEEGEYCEIVCYDESTDRFTPKKSITINPPSKVLHVSGMKKEKCTVGEIVGMFKDVVEPTRVKILKQNADKNMALVEFSCLQDSFDVVADCHNMLVGGRKIQISFTKSQI